MNHKRGRPKNRRAGCLMYKPWKANGCQCRSNKEAAKRKRMAKEIKEA